jgi:hypothetical protein
MPFRDDQEALRNRIANLEEDLRDRDEARDKIAALDDRVKQLESANAHPSPVPVPETRKTETRAPGASAAGKTPRSPQPLPAALMVLPAFLCFQFTMCSPSLVAPEAHAIGWIACPSNFASAYVATTSDQRGQHWSVMCEMGNGSIVPASSSLESVAATFYVFFALLVGVGAHRVVRGARARRFHPRRRTGA